jgi:predicted nucleotidyltransferase
MQQRRRTPVTFIGEAHLRVWARQSGADLCVLFGSRAAPAPRVTGDVDVAVLFASLPSPERRLKLLGELQGACGGDDADLIFLHEQTEPVLRFEIFRTGKPVFEKETGLFVEEKVRALMLYEDALPFRRIRRERLRRIARGDADLVT